MNASNYEVHRADKQEEKGVPILVFRKAYKVLDKDEKSPGANFQITALIWKIETALHVHVPLQVVSTPDLQLKTKAT